MSSAPTPDRTIQLAQSLNLDAILDLRTGGVRMANYVFLHAYKSPRGDVTVTVRELSTNSTIAVQGVLELVVPHIGLRMPKRSV